MNNSETPPAYEIIKIPDIGVEGRVELRQQCYDLRIEVFVHEQGFPLDVEIDEADETSTHLLLRLVPSLTPVGTIRATKIPSSKYGGEAYYKLSRLVVLNQYRKFRFGRALVLALHHWVKENASKTSSEYAVIVAHAQLYVKPFYAKYGYESDGPEFDEDGAPHQKMIARIPLSSPTISSTD